MLKVNFILYIPVSSTFHSCESENYSVLRLNYIILSSIEQRCQILQQFINLFISSTERHSMHLKSPSSALTVHLQVHDHVLSALVRMIAWVLYRWKMISSTSTRSWIKTKNLSHQPARSWTWMCSRMKTHLHLKHKWFHQNEITCEALTAMWPLLDWEWHRVEPSSDQNVLKTHSAPFKTKDTRVKIIHLHHRRSSQWTSNKISNNRWERQFQLWMFSRHHQRC